ncbi:MAG: diphosphomevalonate decarboxylase [Thermoproteota archaeon]|nr:diphosphomevalonate decarboxylase [Thermoproteota archaeon]
MLKTALSHPNKALVIYWGNENDMLRTPTRSSLSVTLQGINHPLDYIVSLRTIGASERDKIIIDGIEDKGEIRSHFVYHLNAMRRYTGFKEKLEVTTRTSFPVGSGLAGSAASASALAEAFAGLIGKTEDTRLKSIMARRGSGSASRSVFGGFVMWQKGNSDDSSYARQLFNENHWDLRNVIGMVSSTPKKIRSIEGMKLSKRTCPAEIYSEFVSVANHHIEGISTAVLERDIGKLGALYEKENYLFRQVCLKTTPPLDYWTKVTDNILNKVANLRNDGVPAYAGTDAGPNVHVFTQPNYVERVIRTIQEAEGILDIIHCRVGKGSHLIEEHLF